MLKRYLKEPEGLPYFKAIADPKSMPRKKDVKKGDAFIFRSKRGGQLSHDQVRSVFINIMDKAGLSAYGYTPTPLHGIARIAKSAPTL